MCRLARPSVSVLCPMCCVIFPQFYFVFSIDLFLMFMHQFQMFMYRFETPDGNTFAGVCVCVCVFERTEGGREGETLNEKMSLHTLIT